MKNILEGLNEEGRLKLAEKIRKHTHASAQFYKDEKEEWEEYEKIYQNIQDETDDEEPNMLVPLAFGIVEDAVARNATPFLQKLPIQVKPKEADHVPKAKKFFNACRDYFGSSKCRVQKIESSREKVITGNNFEFDHWYNEWVEGKIWKTEKVESKFEKYLPTLNKMVNGDTEHDEIKEVPHRYPERVGYATTSPSVHHVYCQPGILKLKDSKWLQEEEVEVAIEDLKKAVYTNAQTGETIPVYDLTQMLKDSGDPEKIRPVKSAEVTSSPDIEKTVSGQDSETVDSDVPAVHLIHEHTHNGITTLAQGRWIIRGIDELYHKPGIKARHNVYTQNKNKLMGTGAIKPVKEMIYEKSDIHNMAIANWFRLIHQMTMYDERAFPYEDDFKPRAGGRVRVDLSRAVGINTVRDAFAVADQKDVTNSMLAMESNSSGIIERNLAISDLSPGVQGTKQFHKTASGLLEIQKNLAQRFTIMAVLDLAALQEQMETMYWMFEQFMWDKMSFSTWNESGVFQAEDYVREDFDTGGKGFIFIQSEDPSFGDKAIERNQEMILMEIAMKYEQYRRTVRDPEMKKLVIDELMKTLLESFGRQDTSKLLVVDAGVVSAEDEFTAILQGADIQPNPKENMIGHVLDHVIKRNSPDFVQGVASGQIPPEIPMKLNKHIQDTLAMIQTIVSDPDTAAQALNSEQALQGTPDLEALGAMSPKLLQPASVGGTISEPGGMA